MRRKMLASIPKLSSQKREKSKKIKTFCANCGQSLILDDDDFNNVEIIGVFDITIDSKKSKRKCSTSKLTVMKVLSSIYRLDYLKEMDDDENEDSLIAVCPPCAHVLTNMYQLHEEFNQLRSHESFLSCKIGKLDSFIYKLSQERIDDVQQQPDDDETEDPNYLCFDEKSQNSDLSLDSNNDQLNDDYDNYIDESPTNNIPVKCEVESLPCDDDDDSFTHSLLSNISVKCEVESVTLDLDCNSDDFQIESIEPPTIKSNPRKRNKNSTPQLTKKLKKQPRKVTPGTPDSQACTLCSKHYKKSDLLQHYFSLHIEKGSSVCPLCSKLFNDRTNLKRHLQTTHIGNSTQSCPICGKNFNHPLYLKNHIKRHTTERNFLCNECGKKFKSQSDLTHHLLTHLKQKQHLCHICAKTFKTYRQRSAHELIHVEVQWHACKVPNCDQRFTDYSLLQRHLQTHVTSGETPSSSKRFLINSESQILKNQNTNQKKHSCHVCGSSFNLAQSLKNHIAAFHAQVKQHVCLICGLSTASNAHLRTHMKTHTGERNHQCEVCSKKFLRAWHLKQHMYTHTGEKFYKCQVEGCDYATAQAASLRIHMNRHTGDFRFSCHICHEKLRDSLRLKKHFVKFHSNTT